mgnify:CR=1 FL=1
MYLDDTKGMDTNRVNVLSSSTVAALARVDSALVSLEGDDLVAALLARLQAAESKGRNDAMTGLLNRGALFDDHSLFRGMMGYVTVVDLDGLKFINDTQGHAVGDRYINAAAASLSRAANEACGQAYRIGGDEMVLITRYPIRFPEDVCASFGSILRTIGMSLDVALEIADRNMYAQKKERKSQIARNEER